MTKATPVYYRAALVSRDVGGVEVIYSRGIHPWAFDAPDRAVLKYYDVATHPHDGGEVESRIEEELEQYRRKETAVASETLAALIATQARRSRLVEANTPESVCATLDIGACERRNMDVLSIWVDGESRENARIYARSGNGAIEWHEVGRESIDYAREITRRAECRARYSSDWQECVKAFEKQYNPVEDEALKASVWQALVSLALEPNYTGNIPPAGQCGDTLSGVLKDPIRKHRQEAWTAYKAANLRKEEA